MENNHDKHFYDGIEEQNNPMPGWWIWLFILTVIFGGLYYIHYTFGGGATLKQELEVALKELKQIQASAPAGADVTDEALALLGKDPNALAMGGKVFSEKCSMCHGVELQGLVGPNLTDKFWIHGKGTHKDIFNVVANGVADKGMPAWNSVLKEDELKAVAAFIFSKKGTTPPNPKAPQGEPVDN